MKTIKYSNLNRKLNSKVGSKTSLFTLLLILSYLLLSYYALGGWWNSSVGTLLILFFSYLIWKKDFLKNAGLKISTSNIIISVLLAFGLTVLFFYFIRSIAQNNQVAIKTTNIFNYYHIFFYTLNEEIVLGALIIFSAVYKLKIKPVIASFCLAIIFSVIHFIFYKWIFLEKGTLTIITLLTLFMVGLIRNNLIISTGHIGYSWALHFSWMVIMFGLFHYHQQTDDKLLEFERFNLYLGSIELLVASLIGAISSFVFFYLIKRKKLEPENQNRIITNF